MTEQTGLKARLEKPELLLTPGVFDAFGAMLAEQAGFEALYVSGASIAYTRLGRPDIGLVGMEEVASVVGHIRERVDLPLVVDADTGFGNAINVQRTVRVFERAGASAIQLEDQAMPKRCGHLKGKSLVSTAEMVGKIKAAVDARSDEGTLIVARTDAIAVEGFAPALDRADAYARAGADVLFVEAPRTADEIQAVIDRFGTRIPLLANMVEGGQTPIHDAAQLEALGFSIAIFPGGLARALAKAGADYFASLKQHGTTDAYRDRMLDFTELNAVLGTDDILSSGQQYDAENQE